MYVIDSPLQAPRFLLQVLNIPRERIFRDGHDFDGTGGAHWKPEASIEVGITFHESRKLSLEVMRLGLGALVCLMQHGCVVNPIRAEDVRDQLALQAGLGNREPQVIVLPPEPTVLDELGGIPAE